MTHPPDTAVVPGWDNAEVRGSSRWAQRRRGKSVLGATHGGGRLMSEFLSRLGGAALNDLKGTPLDKILNHLMGGQQGASGLEALVEKLRDGGLREQVESWISTGSNRPVAPQEVEEALGEGETDRLASSTGVERPGLL